LYSKATKPAMRVMTGKIEVMRKIYYVVKTFRSWPPRYYESRVLKDVRERKIETLVAVVLLSY